MAYYCEPEKKWIRCNVDAIKQFGESKNETVILWAIDYGFPFHISNLRDLFLLQEQSCQEPSKIFVAGLLVMPAETRFNHVDCVKEKVIRSEWNQRALTLFRDCVKNEASLLSFVLSTKFSHGAIKIGDVLVGDQDNVHFGLSNHLVKSGVAVSVPQDKFLKYHKSLNIDLNERWNDNFLTGGILKNEEGILSLPSLKSYVKGERDEGFDDSASIPGSTYKKKILKKVEEWQIRNEVFTNESDAVVEDFESLASFSEASSVKSFNISSPATEPFSNEIHTLTASELRAWRSKVSEDIEKMPAVSPQQATPRRVIFMPAGGSMNTNNRQPTYIDTSTPFSTTKDFSKDFSSIEDDNFTSVSQQRYHPPPTPSGKFLSRYRFKATAIPSADAAQSSTSQN